MDKRTQKIGILTLSIFFVLAFSLCVFPNSDESVTTIELTEPTVEKQHEIAGTVIDEPVLQNGHPDDYLYAKARWYKITLNLSMGLTETSYMVDFVKLALYSNSRIGDPLWVLVFNENTKAYYIESGSDKISLLAGNYSQNLHELDLEFHILIDWDHYEWTDTDTYVLVDYTPIGDVSSWFETNWNFETGISYTTVPSVTDDTYGTPDIGNLDEAFEITGSFRYNGTTLTPPASAVDIWVIGSQYGTNVGPWRDTDYDGSGAISITCYADDAPGEDTYTIKIVDAGAGSTAPDHISVSPTTTYFADQIQVHSYSRDDDDERINIQSEASMYVTLVFDSDDSFVTDTDVETVSINSIGATYIDDGIWHFTNTEFSPAELTYDSVVVTPSADGITLVDQNSKSLTQIWDRIVVESYYVSDNIVNIGTNVDVEVTLKYESDNSPVDNATVHVNGEEAFHDTLGVYTFTVSEPTPTSNLYNDVQCTGGYGITIEDQNDQSQAVIWDQIVVLGYEIVTPAGDDRVSVGTTVTIDVQLRYAHLLSDVTDASGCTVTVNGISTSYQSLGKWRFSTSETAMIDVEFETVIVSLDQYGISEVDNLITLVVIWDQIVVTNSEVVGGDNRVSINDYIQIDVTLDYYHDNTDVLDGSVTVNGEAADHMGNGVWRINVTSDLVQMRNFTTVACTGNTHGITVVDQNGQSSSVIWDRLLVDIESNYIEPDNDITVSFTLTVTYDFDDAACTTYYIAIYKNGEFFGIFTEVNKSSFQDSDADATNNYTAYEVLDEATYGITAFVSNTESVTWLEGGSTSPTPTTTTSDTGTTATDGGWDDSMKITLIGGSATVLFGLIGLLFKADMIEKKKHKGGIVFVGVVLLALGAYAIWMFL